VEVITTTAGLSDWPAEQTGVPLLRRGVSVTYYPVDQPTGAIRSKALLADLPRRLQGVNLLHLSAIWQPLGPAVQRLAAGARVPVISSLRGALGPYSFSRSAWKKFPYYWLVERPLLLRAAALHVTSAQESDELRRWPLALTPQRPPSWLLPNPLDPLCFAEPLAPAEPRSVQRQLLVCGRHHHKKGLDLLAPVLAGLADQAWQLWLVGPDQDGSAAALKRQLARCGLASRISCLPLQTGAELTALFQRADLLLMPSRHENFGNVALEALACACPVLLSQAVGAAADLERVMAAEPWGAVLPRRVAAWQAWLRQWLLAPRRRPSPDPLRAYAGSTAVAERCLQAYQRLLAGMAP
jgi:glycosyltransferase involved in cell wall biosynthesis